MRSLIIASLVFASACGSGTTTYVGTVDGTDVAVGLVSDGSHVALFFCGGPASFATSTKWFRFDGDASSFTATADDWNAVGSASESSASGTVDRGDGVALSWSASRADDGSLVGLYESNDANGTAGVVVRSATNATETQGAFIDEAKEVEQIIPIFPLDLEAKGLHVTIAGVDAFLPRAVP
jgi:hypothetical protein